MVATLFNYSIQISFFSFLQNIIFQTEKKYRLEKIYFDGKKIEIYLYCHQKLAMAMLNIILVCRGTSLSHLTQSYSVALKLVVIILNLKRLNVDSIFFNDWTLENFQSTKK